MGEFAIGQSVLRREDPRLLRGQGRFFDDLRLADQLHAAIVRSPHAHADITGIDTRAALQAPGIHAVLTGEDYRADGLGSLPSMAPYKMRGGGPMFVPPRPAIARDRVMHVGYPVAVVVADTLDQAHDAAERVVVDYLSRPAVVSARDAFAPDAPQLYDECPRNEAYFYQAGDKAAVDAAFARAAHVVEQHLVINRVTANTLEPRGVTGEYDAGTGRYTLHCGFQRPWLFRNDIARTTLKIPEAELRLITGDIGGSYGLRGSVYPEIILLLWAARRPVIAFIFAIFFAHLLQPVVGRFQRWLGLARVKAVAVTYLVLLVGLLIFGFTVGVLGRGPAGKAMLYRSIGGECGGRPIFDATAPLLPGFTAPAAFVF